MASDYGYYKTIDKGGRVVEMSTRPFEAPSNGEFHVVKVTSPDTERVNPFLAKRCPFCGCRPGFSFEGEDSDLWPAEVGCDNPECPAKEPEIEAHTIETALWVWNKRHGEKKRSMTPKQEECLQEALESLATLEQPPMEACDVKYQDSHQEAIENIKGHLQNVLEDDEDAIMIKLQENNKGACKIVTDFGVGGMQRWEGTSSGAVMAEIFKSIQKVSEPEE